MRIGRGIGIAGTVTAAVVGLAGCVARTVPVTNVKEVVERSEDGLGVLYQGEESDANKLKVFASIEYEGQEMLGESLTRYEAPGTSECTKVEASYFDFMSMPAPLVVTDEGCNGSVEYAEMEGMDRLLRADGADVLFDELLPAVQADLEEVAGYSQRLRAWHERKGVE